jgi:hypothetical protein
VTTWAGDGIANEIGPLVGGAEDLVLDGLGVDDHDVAGEAEELAPPGARARRLIRRSE